MVNNKALLNIALVLTVIASLFIISPQVAAAADAPEKQQNADNSTTGISDRLASCIGDGYGSLGMTANYQNCVVLECRKMSNLQYRDRCLKDGFNLHSCKGIADTTQTEATYLGCVNGMANKCNALGTVAVDGSTPKDRCFEAAAWYISRYSNNRDGGYGTVGHGTAYVEYLPLLKGDLDLVEAVDFVRETRGQSPLAPNEEEIDDAAGAPGEDGEDDPGKDPTADGTVQDNLECTTASGEEGIGLSIPIFGSDPCIAKGNGSIDSNPILTLMKLVLQVASAGVGLVVAIMIIVAGIQYTSAQGNPQLVQAAKQRLTNAIIGLAMYILAFALLNYLVPGNLIG